VFEGKVVNFNPINGLYAIKYDDDDEEDVDEEEITRIVQVPSPKKKPKFEQVYGIGTTIKKVCIAYI
jgi:hypothetical protein